MVQQARAGAEMGMPRLEEMVRMFLQQVPTMGITEDQLLSMFGGFMSQVQEAAMSQGQETSPNLPAGVGAAEETTAAPRGMMSAQLPEPLRRR